VGNVAATLVNVVLAFVPNALIAVKHTMIINASITAYSTAVGPSSERIKRRNFRASDFMDIPPLRFSFPRGNYRIIRKKWVPSGNNAAFFNAAPACVVFTLQSPALVKASSSSIAAL
jgi:hypothetical protein